MKQAVVTEGFEKRRVYTNSEPKTEKPKGENTMKDKPIEGNSIAEKMELMSEREVKEILVKGFDISMLINVAGDLAKFQVSAKEIEEELRNLVLQSRVFLKLSLDKAIESLTVKECDHKWIGLHGHPAAFECEFCHELEKAGNIYKNDDTD